MDSEKGAHATTVEGNPAPRGHVPLKYMGTAADKLDMSTLGREQVLRRNFRFISILGFGCTLIATWEVILTFLAQGLTDGGTAGLIWGYVVVATGFFLVFTSLAEMASMYTFVVLVIWDDHKLIAYP
jgi:amino acid permease